MFYQHVTLETYLICPGWALAVRITTRFKYQVQRFDILSRMQIDHGDIPSESVTEALSRVMMISLTCMRRARTTPRCSKPRWSPKTTLYDQLTPRRKKLVILTVAWIRKARYESHQHVDIARPKGVEVLA